MKKLMIVIFLLAFIIPVFPQGYQPWQGGLLSFYSQSARIGTWNEKVSGVPVTYVCENDTFYTKLSQIYSADGVYKIEFSSAAPDTASTGLKIDVAFFNPTRASCCKWTSWYRVFTDLSTDALYRVTIDPADSTWWMPEYQRQYRIYGATDSLEAHLIDFIK